MNEMNDHAKSFLTCYVCCRTIIFFDHLFVIRFATARDKAYSCQTNNIDLALYIPTHTTCCYEKKPKKKKEEERLYYHQGGKVRSG